jgi:ABC-type glutathione transport system ATPase component
MTVRYHEIPPLPGGISWYTTTATIDRSTDRNLVRTALRRSRVVALLGPHQCGKTTLARMFVPADLNWPILGSTQQACSKDVAAKMTFHDYGTLAGPP